MLTTLLILILLDYLEKTGEIILIVNTCLEKWREVLI